MNGDLWRYEVEYSGKDCDGTHYGRREFLGVEHPDEVVYAKADLFSEFGPSSVSLVEGSDRKSGTAQVGTPNDEGGYSSYQITWNMVTDPKVLDEFLENYETNGPRLSTEYRYTDLYRRRVRRLVREAFPTAELLKIRPSRANSERWVLAEVQTWENHRRVALWDEAKPTPFSEDVGKRIIHDLGQMYGIVDVVDPDGDEVRL